MMDNDFLLNLHLESSSSSPAMDESFLHPSVWDTHPPNLTAADPAFADRAARFSCFGTRSFNGRTHLKMMPRVSSSPSLHHLQVEEDHQNPLKPNSRKRKTISKGDGNSNAKRSRAAAQEKTEEDERKKQRAAEAPKDYIHVRARRGQATDSHSLAERVRREKISERMKLLQDLVPGCNKLTGKALMLDEIINYVQSLQGQVEFLSMKLASVNTTTSPTMDSLLSKSKHMFQSNNTSTMCPSSFFGHQNESLHGTPNQSSVDPLDSELCTNLGLHLSQVDGFGEGALQYPRFCQDDLQSIVQMGFSHNVHGSTQEPSPMKIEL